MKKFKMVFFAGTRPEFIKLWPLISSSKKFFSSEVIHTGQHYSSSMSQKIIADLGLKVPKHNLTVGSGTPGKQLSAIIKKAESYLIEHRPDIVVVQGDTNSTLGVALAAAKQNIYLVHVEAGYRCGNKKMPEENNRVLTDHLANLNICFDQETVRNLKNEGLGHNYAQFSNTSFQSAKENYQKIKKPEQYLAKWRLLPGEYALLTIHRAETTNSPDKMKKIFKSLEKVANDIPLVFPIHPRTKKLLAKYKLKLSSRIKLIPPQGYLHFMSLLAQAKFVLSDSGGVVDESIVFNRPLFILRNETERNDVVKSGKAKIVRIDQSAADMDKQFASLTKVSQLDKMKKAKYSADYKVGEKILKAIQKHFKSS